MVINKLTRGDEQQAVGVEGARKARRGGQSSERFATGDQQLSVGGEGRESVAADQAQGDFQLATSNKRPEGRGGSRAARIQSSERFAARGEQLSVEGEGWKSGGAARQPKLKTDLRLVMSD